MIGKLYLVRQAATLLKFAKSTANPELSAVLIEKAADLTSRVDEIRTMDRSHVPPMWSPKKAAATVSAR